MSTPKRNQFNLADPFVIGDVIFAEKQGYMPWPGKVIAKHSRAALVQFMATNENQRIPYSRMWPYNAETKARFITSSSLEYDDFRDAIFITERLLGDAEYRIIDTVWDILNPTVEDELILGPQPMIAASAPRTKHEMELSFVSEVRKQHGTLHVEAQFIDLINLLRANIGETITNYPVAMNAFQQLLLMPFSQLVLVRNFEAVQSIFLLGRLVVEVQDPNYQNAILIRDTANQLLERWKQLFPEPYVKESFWSEYCWLASAYRRHTTPIVQ